MTNPNIIKISSIWLLFMAISVDAQETSKRTFGGINVSTNGYGIFLQSYFSKSNSKIKSFTFEKFSIQIKIKKNKKNPMRAWTFPLKKYNQITVGTGQLLNYYIVKIKLK